MWHLPAGVIGYASPHLGLHTALHLALSAPTLHRPGAGRTHGTTLAKASWLAVAPPPTKPPETVPK